MKVSDAKNRFSAVHFGAGTADMFSNYHCPKCDKITVVTDSMIRKSLSNEETLLSSKIVKDIDKLRPLNEHEWEEFCDFECSFCKGAVRVIYIPNEFRMAAYNFQIRVVIEV